ncbi:exopolysaccharide biosynthesis polyprenyl glycosylphosphotransferase [Roseomonas rosulenta]|uniref:exopolysaccharide biosynthesis polyprenyl glycosylphosphotransferase n=1 Tax=Roseomonas rosulenta TaxID=2748667 RepID=UPI0018E003DC|nr:exopolysaccharide biosynthesis polyprenyl glycosylphosphotransferase [Roseomonas rosulenta]
MASYPGENPRFGAVILVLVDTLAAAVVALWVADELGVRGAVSGWPLVLNAVLLCACFVATLVASGFYKPQVWMMPRRLAARALVAAAILVIGVSLAGSAKANWLGSAGLKIWSIPILFIAAAAAFRLGVVIALRSGVLPPEVPLIARLEAAGAGAVPPDAPALAMSAQGSSPMPHHTGTFPAGGTRSAAEGLSGASWSEAAAARDASRGRVDLETLPADWLDGAAIVGEGRAIRLVRRSFDILGSLMLILAVLPLLLLTALAIRLESRGPVFYRQERVGKDGRVFTLFKFRSMTVDAERDGPCWAQQRDPRVTRVGRLIRLTRIDEVPQVINVLSGEMSLIGPRPERPNFVEQLAAVIPHYRCRAAVKPGITGWAQVNYPYGASVEDARNKLAYDLYYIRHRSLAMDFAIVLGTIRVILLQEGAR